MRQTLLAIMMAVTFFLVSLLREKKLTTKIKRDKSMCMSYIDELNITNDANMRLDVNKNGNI